MMKLLIILWRLALKNLRVEIETNPVQNRFLEEHSDLLIQKTFKINELEDNLRKYKKYQS